ncbi:uncharacterized protein BP5553_02165 [Venustampulla echinocandica]|uniref:Uncharacterized protein n=1 Tax=Venustampulla echinocandica TaxID=2656787 RepID=A0A370U330_9HELO|nr:uncharacterized protein BP5553_02165 [Venustampulla echinocandica]RDL42186.1 hypothetical protein BP5553_02165 [Venustampulla echinocandica]
MRLNSSNAVLFSLSCLYCLSASLPLSPPKPVFVEPLVRRAKYSVVAVDGGPGAREGGDGSSPEAVPSTIISTIVQTKTAEPTTVVKTDKVTLPPITQTDRVTVIPTPAKVTVTATGYSIINVNSAANPAEVTAPASSPSPSSASGSDSASEDAPELPATELSSTQPSSTQPSPTKPSPTKPSPTQPSPTKPSPTQPSSETISTPGSTLSTSASAAAASASAKPHDNGQWHTSYPAWSNSTGTSTALAAKAPEIPTTGASSEGVRHDETIESRALSQPIAGLLKPGYKRGTGESIVSKSKSPWNIIRSIFM